MVARIDLLSSLLKFEAEKLTSKENVRRSTLDSSRHSLCVSALEKKMKQRRLFVCVHCLAGRVGSAVQYIPCPLCCLWSLVPTYLVLYCSLYCTVHVPGWHSLLQYSTLALLFPVSNSFRVSSVSWIVKCTQCIVCVFCILLKRTTVTRKLREPFQSYVGSMMINNSNGRLGFT